MKQEESQEATAVVAGKVEVLAKLQKLCGLTASPDLENRNGENGGVGRVAKNRNLRPKLSALSTEIFIGS